MKGATVETGYSLQVPLFIEVEIKSSLAHMMANITQEHNRIKVNCTTIYLFVFQKRLKTRV